jgi:hypothetical protein
MPAPLLVVQVPTLGNGGAETAALIEACTSAIAPGRCELANASPSGRAAAVAVVSFRSTDRTHALLEVGRRQPDQQQAWLSQELSFKSEDALVERYRALGLAMGSLFRDLREQEGRPIRTHRRDEPAITPGDDTRRPASDERARSHASKARPLWLNAALVAGNDFELTLPRFGAQATFYAAPLRAPVFLSVAGRYAQADAPAGVSLRWVLFGLGVGTRGSLGPFELRVRVEGIAEDLIATAESDGPGGSETAAAWVLGARAVGEAVWPDQGPIGVVAAAGLERLSKPSEVTVHRERILHLPGTSWAAGLGVELRPIAP